MTLPKDALFKVALSRLPQFLITGESIGAEAALDPAEAAQARRPLREPLDQRDEGLVETFTRTVRPVDAQEESPHRLLTRPPANADDLGLG